MGPPNALLRRGWKKSSMQFGAVIKVDGFAAKNGKEFANATDITLPDGTKIFAGTDEAAAVVAQVSAIRRSTAVARQSCAEFIRRHPPRALRPRQVSVLIVVTAYR